jgi:periplasmic protein CpxP/Spy
LVNKETQMKKSMIGIAVLALSATFAFAGPHQNGGTNEGRHGRGHGKHGKHGRQMMHRLGEKLNLTEQQKQQMAEIKNATREENAAFFETSRSTMKEMRAARKAQDTAKIESLKPVLESQREQWKQIREAETAKFNAILTAEQRAQFDALKAERQARRKERG